ncbi:beta-glucosidase [Microbacterium sp. EYE_5]|nr:beta-glucosidase [Microbacterium sp. EYE_382]MCK6084667.1 beta-glucosidase [Microbacterium sp. EYE_384]MCK6123104.1 beta-glucosidase [Microbacterium sp. EYE_80]MCK6125431.1 beta-glucosidase [Microbacterium sp. EYE_79]MCK6140351.1 beta-glucosidase [Microbacterium sp. EYE_39]MCK6217078.1 beta-glucosidase [Microbacterium sp. EYE_5]MCK6227435.1 beta-glucosidase [Microbacterium sp. EYE_77]MCK6246519.1 beta-glucosidase [Microbacterium sp. EYE_78]
MYQAHLSPGHLSFPQSFVLGASTAAYQIEGGADAGGRGPSIWDTFSHTPGKTARGATGDIAADHYHRVEEDLGHMTDLNLDAYRFSISWPRVMPAGEGGVNEEGIAFYSRLVDGLLARGIRPVVTLNHWDLPQALEDKYGGWRGRETAYAFEKYAEVVGAALGDRVDVWSTHNEPWNNSFSGYGSGAFAPGGTSHADALAAAHHLNLSHGLAVRALRRTITKPGAQISVALNIFRIQPASPIDGEAARLFDAVANRIFTGPMLYGRYDSDLLADTARFSDWSFVLPGDLEVAHQPLDVLGVNYYEVMHVRVNPDYDPQKEQHGGTAFPGSERIEFVRKSELARTGMDWGIEPTGLEEHIVALSEEFPDLAIMVMENGAAFADDVIEDEGTRRVLDHERTRYIADHIAAVYRAHERGAKITGYFVWSLLDNFEWAAGYEPRFGIIHVDYETLQRTPKLSGHFFAELCSSRSIPVLHAPEVQPTR